MTDLLITASPYLITIALGLLISRLIFGPWR